jgi:hypothetical protein
MWQATFMKTYFIVGRNWRDKSVSAIDVASNINENMYFIVGRNWTRCLIGG